MRNSIIACIITLLVGVSVGRYSLPARVETRTVTVERQATSDHSTTTTTKRPDGTTTIVTHNDINTIDQTNSQSSTVTERETQRWALNVTAAIRPAIGQYQPVYGLSVQYRLVGPFTVGAFGMLDGTLGASAGVRF